MRFLEDIIFSLKERLKPRTERAEIYIQCINYNLCLQIQYVILILRYFAKSETISSHIRFHAMTGIKTLRKTNF